MQKALKYAIDVSCLFCKLSKIAQNISNETKKIATIYLFNVIKLFANFNLYLTRNASYYRIQSAVDKENILPCDLHTAGLILP